MSKSIERVAKAAAEAGLPIEIRRMGESTRTAAEAARQCGCEIDQIVKSLIFAGKSSGRLYLFLVPGSRKLDVAKAGLLVGEDLDRADPRQVREETGFAIGGVSPLGQPDSVRRYADETLLRFGQVWAAAGAHDAVFAAEPRALIAAAGAHVSDIVA
ncbi:YbaK/EbsC family protein [Chelativorans sp.]|uniref:YbaK/EbsC family protein n=1 Tax=Chelativorans sp. TaxID=2203393 RepID=UPI0028124532|nr:YbaK/EbsC family protein [Chelativorans sp.]